jgi:protein pelota
MKEGKIVLKIETLDDLWHLYNVVIPGDTVIARTARRIRIGDEDARKQESIRKPMTLVLEVEDIAFHNFTNRIRIKGKILEGPSDLVSIGSYHTFNIEEGDVLTIIKEQWPGYLLKRLKEAEKAQVRPKCLIVTIEDGTSEIFLAADYGIREAVSVRTSISRKRGDQKSHDATMRDFFSDVGVALQSQLEQHSIGLIVIAGPGFVRDHFREHLKSMAIKDSPPIVVEGTSNVGITGAKEILHRGVISKALTELKLETETKLIEDILAHLGKDDGLVAYGDAEVEKAIQFGAVEELLITDKKLRESTDENRRRIDRLIRDTEKTRGNFHVVSTEHPSGDQLQNLGGIAAILRFQIG